MTAIAPGGDQGRAAAGEAGRMAGTMVLSRRPSVDVPAPGGPSIRRV